MVSDSLLGVPDSVRVSTRITRLDTAITALELPVSGTVAPMPLTWQFLTSDRRV